METSLAVAAVVACALLFWGWAVLCWTIRDMHAKTAAALERQQEMNTEQARHIWTLAGSQDPAKAQAVAVLETAGRPHGIHNDVPAYLDDAAMSRM